MSEDYNPNSISAVLSRIEERQRDQGIKLDRIEENQSLLWKAHSSLRVKVAGIAALAGIAVAAGTEWLKSIFTNK